jgi:pimeloyl-ACP methyl ester carboxylesterase
MFEMPNSLQRFRSQARPFGGASAGLRLVIVLTATLCVSGGCTNPPAATMSQADHGLVWMLPGIEGGPAAFSWAHAGLRAGGVKSAIRVFDWERPGRPLDNLTDYEGNLVKAADIADHICEYRESHATQPIDVVGYSGGGGLAVMVAEALPRNVHLRNLILAQAAISPDYDLSKAAARVDGKIVNFYCPSDWMVLGLGTRVFGTIDRKDSDSAGMVSFKVPRDSKRYNGKLVQRPWTLRWMCSGHFGSHIGILTYGWNRDFVAPYLAPCESGETAKTRE